MKRAGLRAAAAGTVCLALSAAPTVLAQPADPEEVVAPPVLTAAGAVLWDPEDDRVLFGKAEDDGRPMASATKLMTVLLAVEAGAVGDTVTVSPTAAALGGATLQLEAGQRVAMESLIAGLLLESGNDAATAVAEHVAGSEEAFVAAMNVRAGELGLADTQFFDPHGLNVEPAHRASPLDLARLADAAMAHEVVARYASMTSATVSGIPPLANRNELLADYRWATGVKTGYTSLAGFCLVASAERNGRTLYAVVLDSGDRFGEARALLEYGFDAFRRVEPVPENGAATRYRWADAEVAALLDGRLAATVPLGADVAWRTRLAPLAARPLRAGEQLGHAELHVDGRVEAEVQLVAERDVAARPVADPAAAVGGAVQEALRAFARMAEIDRAAD